MEISGNQQSKISTLEGVTPTKVVVKTAEVRVEKTSSPDSGAAVVQQNSQNKDETQNQAGNLHVAVSQINDHVQSLQRNLQFTVDDITGKDIVTVVDTDTEQVIRQIPSEEVLEVARRITVSSEDAVQLFSTKV
jgi:flagellar protein FlaG